MTKKRDAVNVSIDVGKAELGESLLECKQIYQTANKSASTCALVTCPGLGSAGADRDRNNRPVGTAIR